MTKYRNGMHNGKPQDVDIDMLIAYLERCIDNKSTYLELTGGEPSLHPDLHRLLDWLADNDYKGHIKTNGQLPMPQILHFPRIAAFHGIDKPPRYWDWVLIMNRDPDKQAKIDYCNQNSMLWRMDNCKILRGMPIQGYANICPSDEGGVVFSCYSHMDMKFDIKSAKLTPFMPTYNCYCANIAGFVWWQPELLKMCTQI